MASAPSHKHPLGILYLDDDRVQLAAFRQSLMGGAYEVTTAESLTAARQVLLKVRPDLVIIDYHVGEMTGDVCLEKLKAGGLRTARYYLYTVDAAAFRRHREMGFDGVLMLKGKSSVRLQIDAIARSMLRARDS
jgi:response regulator RpfG family c-di-GMP phosphodiesterase